MKIFPVIHLITLAALITITSLSVIHTTAQTAARSTNVTTDSTGQFNAIDSFDPQLVTAEDGQRCHYRP